MKCLSGKFGTPFFWRMSLLPHRCNEDDQCEVLAPPQPPSPLDSVQVDQAMYFLNEDTLRLVISWRRPMYPNGILRHYQLRIGTVPILSREDSQESGITILTRTAIGVSYLLSCIMLSVVLDSLFFFFYPSIHLPFSLSLSLSL